jgi:hypothetical protein
VTAGPLPALTAKGVEGQLGAVKIWGNSTSLVIWQTWVNSGEVWILIMYIYIHIIVYLFHYLCILICYLFIYWFIYLFMYKKRQFHYIHTYVIIYEYICIYDIIWWYIDICVVWITFVLFGIAIIMIDQMMSWLIRRWHKQLHRHEWARRKADL